MAKRKKGEPSTPNLHRTKPWGSHNGLGGRAIDEAHHQTLEQIYARSELERAHAHRANTRLH